MSAGREVYQHTDEWGDQLQVREAAGKNGLTFHTSHIAGLASGGVFIPDAALPELLRKIQGRLDMLALDAAQQLRREVLDCTCVEDCNQDPATACSLSGRPHVHPDDGSGTFGPCPVHPDRPGDR